MKMNAEDERGVRAKVHASLTVIFIGARKTGADNRRIFLQWFL